jgi:hypothetical protein
MEGTMERDMSEDACISSADSIAHPPSTSYQSKETRRKKHHHHQSQLLLPAATLLSATEPKHALDHSAESACVDFESERSLIHIE